jgi:small membrane protein
MLIQLLIILFSLFALSRLRVKFKNKEISGKEFFLWTPFWLLVIGATIWFKQTDIIANFFGVEKGADLAVYISIIALFYLIFKIIVKLDKLDKDITQIVRIVAVNKQEIFNSLEKDNRTSIADKE